MGAWGTGIFENDDALDVRYCFHRHLQMGFSVTDATKTCIQDYPDPLNDQYVVLALAALQMEQGDLSPELRQRALRMTEDQTQLWRWVDPERRRREMEQFRNRLLNYRNKS